MEKNTELNKTNQSPKKMMTTSKIFTFLLLLAEMIFIFRGPRVIGVLLFMLTVAVIFIILDHKETKQEDEDGLKKLKKSIKKELNLMKKSSKKLNYNVAKPEQFDAVLAYLDKTYEQYFFIKENYGLDRGKESLDKLTSDMKALDAELKSINNKFLSFYTDRHKMDALSDDLTHIIAQLDAHKELNKED